MSQQQGTALSLSDANTIPQSAKYSRGMQVSGLTWFPEERWREGILNYLMGAWGRKEEVMYRPLLSFRGHTLRLDASKGEYYAYYAFGYASWEVPPVIGGDSVLTVSAYQVEVEQGLIRFVKDESIGMLEITLRNHGAFYLWKRERRGQYGVFSKRIPGSHELAAELL